MGLATQGHGRLCPGRRQGGDAPADTIILKQFFFLLASSRPLNGLGGGYLIKNLRLPQNIGCRICWRKKMQMFFSSCAPAAAAAGVLAAPCYSL